MSRSNTVRKMPVMASPYFESEDEDYYEPTPSARSRRQPQNPTVYKRATKTGLPARVLRFILRHPLDTLATVAVSAMVVSIVNNAVYRQSGSHPAPIFSSAAPAPAIPQPAPNDITAALAQADSAAGTTPSAQSTSHIDIVRNIQGQLASRGMYSGTVDGVFGPRTSAAISAYESAAGMRITGEPSRAVMDSLMGKKAPEGAVTPVNSKMIAVQHVLAEQGFGPLKVDGVFGESTREAIKRFEASRNLPPRGELTTQILRELSAVSGVVLE